MENNQKPNKNMGGNGPKMNMPKFNMNWIYFIAILALGLLYFTSGGTANSSVAKTASYSEFKTMVERGYAKKIVVNKPQSTLRMYVKSEHIRDVFHQGTQQTGVEPYLEVEFGSVDQVEQFVAKAKEDKVFTGDLSFDNRRENEFLSLILSNLIPILFIVGLWIFLMRRMGGGGGGMGGGVFSVGKSKAKMYEKGGELGITFKDVAGQAGAKQEIQEIVDFLKNPQKYTDLGGKIPKGALLVGPPGTGKTLLAKAVAGEAGVPFFSMSGSDFVEMFVGVGASRVRDLFQQAKQKSPCIIFIDEIDAVGRARSKNPAMGGNDERENTLNALLTEMDGFGTNSGVIILAATNRADMLDSALLRAGRFDRQIHVDLPDLNERKEVFKVHLKPVKIDESVDIDFLARQTPGFSGADIANVCNEAALIAARHNSQTVTKQDFLDAVDRIIGGLEKKTKVMTQAEKRSIAIHEAGHATISWFTEFANPLVKVSIVPRGQALGAAWYLPEERVLQTKEAMLDEMCSLLGGRAAEELFVGHISTGAMNDLERTTKQAYGMIAYAGMSDKLPNVCYYNNAEYQFQKPYSETTAKIMDDEVLRMINEQYERAKQILTEHKEGHAQLAQLLIDREVIFAEDVEKIFGKRPWTSRAEELLEAQMKADAERMAEERAKELEAEAAQKALEAKGDEVNQEEKEDKDE
ncbi:ATP-dependent zinc metalloprotease FtsH [Xylanibacter ruminicola]|uniref:ATP-dependent zinc metalloprotease FtsH n=1 Tax=Xylanibacter ruminicola TaxID=839 RepID=A0A1M6UFC6_XYLRU|nr:ATP-dependent zinc metalloprotease FtsH [Xylanibacter ruminicola]SHK67877.1 cell division protease FtsH [Xylanibacter ruminicola]